MVQALCESDAPGWGEEDRTMTKRPRHTPDIADVDIRVVDATAGELLRHLTLDANRDYQPLGRPRGPQPKNKPEPN